jgi:PAS domain-containing protein
LLAITLFIKNKWINLRTSNSKIKLVLTNVHRKELERNYLNTLKDLQDLKFALDESNLVQIVDKSANILYANEKFCRLSEYTFEELKGKNIRVAGIPIKCGWINLLI